MSSLARLRRASVGKPRKDGRDPHPPQRRLHTPWGVAARIRLTWADLHRPSRIAVSAYRRSGHL